MGEAAGPPPVSAGAVARDTDPGRGRTAELHVTAEGARLRRIGTGVVTGVDERLRARLDDETYDALTRAPAALFRAEEER